MTELEQVIKQLEDACAVHKTRHDELAPVIGQEHPMTTPEYHLGSYHALRNTAAKLREILKEGEYSGDTHCRQDGEGGSVEGW